MSTNAVRSRKPHGCDFCKKKIEPGTQHFIHVEKDRFGRYTFRRHIDCEQTAKLSEVAQKWW